MSKELYKRLRPKTLKELVGQPEAVKTLKGMFAKDEVPHALLLVGDSGCGKTTIARILARKLECGKSDYQEINAADFRGIDTVREMRSRIGSLPISGKCRVYVIDECHQLVAAAQNALLKMLEDTPEHVYFVLATTDPQKLLKTIITRCTQIKVRLLGLEDAEELVKRALEAEGKTLNEDVRDKVVQYGEGSARKILVLLDSVLRLEDPKDQIKALEASDIKPQAIELARALISPKPSWGQCSAILSGLGQEDPEQLRWMILGYAKSCLLGKNTIIHRRASLMIQAFENHFYDSKMAGLVNAAYDVCTH